MRADHGKKRGCQQWGRSRSTDGVERAGEWFLVFCAFVAILVSTAFGYGVYGSLTEKSRVQTAERVPVAATVLEEAPAVRDVEGHPTYPVSAKVRWIGRDGAQHTGELSVRGHHLAGDTVPAWLDRQGRLAPDPLTATDSFFAALAGAGMLLIAQCAALAVALAGVRRWVSARNGELWRREWEQVEPRWTGRIA